MLWLAGGVVSPENTTDHEEKEQCIKMHEIIAEHKLEGEFRYFWGGTLSGPDYFTNGPPESIVLPIQ